MIDKISLIIPIKNESDNIRQLLSSIRIQTLQPYEVLLIDGGSVDDTISIVKDESASILNCRLLIASNANISVSRNLGIKNARGTIIACTDAGAFLDKNWLENITKPFNDPSVEVVGGFYKYCSNKTLEKVIGEIYYPSRNRIGKDFIPSARSIAFKKTIWARVGGFPEHLAKAEDTLFFMDLQKARAIIRWAPDALVYWKPRESINAFFKQNYSYAQFDIIAGLFFKRTGYLKQLLAFCIVSATIVLSILSLYPLWLLLVTVYWLLPGVMLIIKIREPIVFLYAPLVVVTLLLSTFLGALSGLYKKNSAKKMVGLTNHKKALL